MVRDARQRVTVRPAQNVRHLVERAWNLEVASRLRKVVRIATLREVGERTGTHPETVRRYLANGRASAHFLAALCRSFDVSPEWLLTGRGQMGTAPKLRRLK